MVGTKPVITGRTKRDQFFDGGNIEHFTIAENDTVYPVIAGTVLVEVIRYSNLVGSFFSRDDQVVGRAGKAEVFLLEAVGEAYGIGSADRGVIVADAILTEAFAEDIGIGTVSAGKVVIARTADEGVVAVSTIETDISIFT